MDRTQTVAPVSLAKAFGIFVVVAAVALLCALFVAPELAHGAAIPDQKAPVTAAIPLKTTTAGGVAKPASTGPVKKLAASDGLPGTEKQPLQAGAAREALTPASFTISGMKYLEGRALREGEFTFRLASAGVYQLPLTSRLSAQLRSDSLSNEEKYALVADSGFQYVASAAQPMPANAITTNAADGEVTFDALTFDKAALGNSATRRSQGAVFCYTISEEVPRNADGTLKEGVEKDDEGRSTYEGVTYDDTEKRVYLYVYEDGSDAAHRYVEIVPLGDATFDAYSDEPEPGEGDGFYNTYLATAPDAGTDSDEPSDGDAVDGDAADGDAADGDAADDDDANGADADEGDGADAGDAGSDDADEGDGDSELKGSPSVEGPEAGTSSVPGAADKPAADKPSADKPAVDEAAVDNTGTDASAPEKPGAASSANSASDSKPAVKPADAPTDKPAASSDSASPASAASQASRPASPSSSTTIVQRAAEVTTDPARAHGMLSQTDDSSVPLLLTLVLAIAASAIFVAFSSRRALA